ncbi:ATP-binding cassette domain-containing protein, partial [Clostridium perfringens]
VGADFHATLDGKQAGEAMQSMIQEARKGRSCDITFKIKDNLSEPNSPQPQFQWDNHSVLELSGIGLRHEELGPASLENVSFRIPGQRKIGIVGESGAGKSTLIELLGGFLAPTSGVMELNGVKLEDRNRQAWRTEVTYMPQQPYLFGATLADNVRFYAPEASTAQVEAAVEAAGLSDLVKSLPGGLAEMIGGGGRTLSGGQAQRVALARALLGGRQVLLLDEPTAHLDIETEYELKETML